MITREDFDKFKAEWETEIDKYQAKDSDCMDVDEQAYYEAVQLAETLLAERDAYRQVASQGAKGFFFTNKRCLDYVDSEAREILKQNT